MPRININVLISHLEEIDNNLSVIWGMIQNYEILEAVEKQRRHLRNIIDTLTNYEAGLRRVDETANGWLGKDDI
jgi:phage regulator Rha-like protein